MFTVRLASAEDASELSQIARSTFEDTFAAHNTQADLEQHLARSFGLAHQTAELQDSAITTLLAFHAGVVCGFAQLRRGQAPACVDAIPAQVIELWRFYVARNWQGRGLAQLLMDSVLANVRRLAATTIWLGVWEKNPRAQAFYKKYGFETVGSHIFMVGSDAQIDEIMSLDLAARVSPQEGETT